MAKATITSWQRTHLVLSITMPERMINWSLLVRVTVWILRFIENLHTKWQLVSKERSAIIERIGAIYRILGQKPLHDYLETNELKMLSLFVDDKGVIRVGGQVNESVTSYEMKHPILLLNKHCISYLITRETHQMGHIGTTTTAAKRLWKFMTWKSWSNINVYRVIKCRQS